MFEAFRLVFVMKFGDNWFVMLIGHNIAGVLFDRTRVSHKHVYASYLLAALAMLCKEQVLCHITSPVITLHHIT